MTTKWKIVTGFVVMVILVGVVLVIGYSGIQKSSASFDEYRRLARLNVAASDLGTAINAATVNIRAFMDEPEERLIINARNETAKFLKILDDNREFARNESTVAMFASLTEGIGTFSAMIDKIQQSTTTNARLYQDVVIQGVLKMAAQIVVMTDTAEKTGNIEALAQFSRTWSELSKFMSSISRFANTHTAEDAKTVRGYLEQTGARMGELQKMLPSDAGRRDFGDLKALYDDLAAAFASMEKSSEELRRELLGINGFLEATSKATDTLNTDVNNQMIAFGAATLESNTSTQNRMLSAGGIAFLLGMIIAAVIVLGIVKVLKDLSAFAGAIAAGNFSHQVRSREKGEIGVMVAAMRGIPSVLEQIIATVNNLANSIRLGHLRDRYDVKTLPGSFANLGDAVNTLSNAYTDLIDAMPLPVIACDRDFKVIYSSRVASATLGDGSASFNCREQTGHHNPGAEDCLGKRAMSTGEVQTEEFAITPHGTHMEVSVTAIPLFNEHREALAFIEIITDLTEIKSRQRTMLTVANEASSISDRVAAAAEELAAQVEQISRGAEIQRQRVESTASAMNEMNATVLEVARNSGEASEQSEGTRSRAENGADLVYKVVNAINKVQEVGGTLHTNMQELGRQAESIGGVMNVISDIADQTNLLALNAAIEAARAGEAGRGFAVVADEVRKLAEKTMEATQEVGANINAIQQSAKINIQEVNLAVESVGEATDLAHSSGEALQEIVNLAAANSAIVASIATAAEEQSATSEEINSAVDEINRITQETSDGMVQSSEAVQDLSSMAQELRRVMEGLR